MDVHGHGSRRTTPKFAKIAIQWTLATSGNMLGLPWGFARSHFGSRHFGSRQTIATPFRCNICYHAVHHRPPDQLAFNAPDPIRGHPVRFQHPRAHDCLAVSCSRCLNSTIQTLRIVMLQHRMFFDYTRDCQTDGTSCTLWFEHYRLEQRTRIAVRDGHCLVLQVSRRFLPANWRPPLDPVIETEEIGLLQTSQRSHRNQPLQHEANKDEHDKIKLDLHPAIVAFEWIDTHLFLPSYAVPDTVQLLPASRDWLNLPTWEIGQQCDSIVVYFDGAYQSPEQKAGLAVAAFVQTGNQWFQAGLISSSVEAHESYTPEVYCCFETHVWSAETSLFHTNWTLLSVVWLRFLDCWKADERRMEFIPYAPCH